MKNYRWLLIVALLLAGAISVPPAVLAASCSCTITNFSTQEKTGPFCEVTHDRDCVKVQSNKSSATIIADCTYFTGDGCKNIDIQEEANKYNESFLEGQPGLVAPPAPSGKSLESLKGTGEGQIGSLNKTGIWNLNAQGLATLFGEFSSFFLGIIGSMMFVLYIWAGAIWMTAAGRSEKIDFAKRVMVWTTLGVVAILASYIVVSFAFKTLTG